ncbi:MAG: CYTH domain-containing protein [Bacteroidia bacterium]|nr:CYTH domain-containing protein [Bacteroidia bacterium]
MEIERKFLVNKILWQDLHNPADASFIQQAYLSTDPKCTVRIRIADSTALITIKGESKGVSREEFEYAVPLRDGLEIIRLAGTPVIIKRRYVILHSGYRWEVDEFLGDNEGLILAEVELNSDTLIPEWPNWIDKEVSGDPRYFNLQLAINPINHWQ